MIILNFMQMRFCHSRKIQNGYAEVLFTFVVLFMLAAISYSVNLMYYRAERQKLLNIAKIVATRGAQFLPNPKLARDNAYNYFKLMRLDLTQGSSAVNNPKSGMKIKFFFTSAKGDRLPYNGDATAFEYDNVVPADNCASGSGSGNCSYQLPILSMTVSLEAETSTHYLWDIFGIGSTNQIIKAESTVAVEPMDVVLVVENSNSLISPLGADCNDDGAADAGEDACIPALFTSGGSTGWDTQLALQDPPSGTKVYRYNKALRYTRQCYGEAARNLKKAAVLLYDTLSSAATVRVGVVYPMTASSLEQARVAVPLNTHPYERYAAAPAPTPDNLNSTVNLNYSSSNYGIDADPNLGSTGHTSIGLEQAYGFADHPQSRCAAATTSALYPVPDHPLKSVLDNTVTTGYYPRKFKSDLSTMLESTGTVDAKDPSWHLRFKSYIPGGSTNYRYARPAGAAALTYTQNLLPREAIWLNNSGYSDFSGVPIPRYNYQHTYFGIIRAIDMLYNAPKRNDGLAVRKKVILVLSDGVDNALDPNNLRQYLGAMPQLTFLKSTTSANVSTPTTLALNQLTGTDQYCNSGIYPSGMDDVLDLHDIETQTGIPDSTAADDVLKGFKLGVMYYGFSGPAYYSTDGFQADLENHGTDATTASRLADFRSDCSTHWALRRGRFWAEASADMTDTTLDDPAEYSSVLAPKVARSLLTPMILR